MLSRVQPHEGDTFRKFSHNTICFMNAIVMPGTAEIQKKKIAQHNKLIHASYSMDTYEYMVYIYMLFAINKEDKVFKEVEIPIELLIGNNRGGKNYELVKSAMLKLQSKIIAIEETFSKRQKKFTTLSMFDYAIFESDSRIIKARFSDRAAPYLLDLLPGNFTLSEMKDMLAIADYQSFRIYNLLKERSYKEEFIFIRVENVIQMLQLSNSYKKNPAYIRTRIIEKARGKLKNTEMAFDYNIKYKGRAIEGYELSLLKNSNKQVLLPEAGQEKTPADEKISAKVADSKVLKNLLKIGFTDKAAASILQEYDEAHVIKCMKILNYQSRKVKLKNPAGYLLGVLKSAATGRHSASQAEIDFSTPVSSIGSANKLRQDILKQLVDSLKQNFFNSYASVITHKISASLTEEQQEQFEIILHKNPRNRSRVPYTTEGKIDIPSVNPALAIIIYEEMGLVNKESAFIDFFYQRTGIILSKEESLPSGYTIQKFSNKVPSPYEKQVHEIINLGFQEKCA